MRRQHISITLKLNRIFGTEKKPWNQVYIILNVLIKQHINLVHFRQKQQR